MNIRKGMILLVTSNELGTGNQELGRLLMTKWLNTMMEAEFLPEKIFLLNGGVLLAMRDSPVLQTLLFLESQEVEIRACGTCVSFFKMSGQLMVGQLGTMSEAQKCILSASSVLTLS
jgi:selenium metabolism protein YedF